MPATADRLSFDFGVDPRICPPENEIWLDPSFFPEQDIRNINHAHGVIAGYVQGPPETRVAIGLNTLMGVNAQQLRARQTLDRDSARDRRSPFMLSLAVMGQETTYGAGLNGHLSGLRFAGSTDEIVPAIVDGYWLRGGSDADDIPPDVPRRLHPQVYRHAARIGVARAVGLALTLSLDSMISEARLAGRGMQFSFDIKDEQGEAAVNPIEGQLAFLWPDFETNDVGLYLRGPNASTRVRLSAVKQIGVTTVSAAA